MKDCWNGLTIKADEKGISGPLSHQINLLGALLGHSVRQQAGGKIFKYVEHLQNLCIDAYETEKAHFREEAQKIIQGLTIEEIWPVLRAFTTFFHLVNGAEKQEIIRINRQRESNSLPDKPRAESIADAIHQLKQNGSTFAEVMEYLQQLDIQPTLTAHPTEARRRSLLIKQQEISDLLEKLRKQKLTSAEEANTQTAIYTQISLLLNTDAIRAENLTVLEEVQQGLYFFGTSIWDTIPRIYTDLEKAILTHYYQKPDLPVILRYRSWIGGDRDGNPFVTTEVTEQTFRAQRITAFQRYLNDLQNLRGELSVSSTIVNIPEELNQSLKNEKEKMGLNDDILRRYQKEPFRLKISYMIEKISQLLAYETIAEAERKGDYNTINYNSDDFTSDLELMRQCLRQCNLTEVAEMTLLSQLIIQSKTFGFHIAALDIRQHSKVHESAVAELLKAAGFQKNYLNLSETERLEVLNIELNNPRPLIPFNTKISETTRATLKTFRVIRKALEKDRKSFGCYIISMTHNVSDFLEVLILAKEAGLWRIENGKVHCEIDVVPLLETIEDLKESEALLDEVFQHPVYRLHLQARQQFQEIMLGYSDSNKDGGYWMANWALYQAQSSLARVCRRHNLQFRLFHGRGGTVGRGGGRANQAILALPPESYTGQIRFTEQGEIITFRYAFPAIAHRHLEQIVNAMLCAAVKQTEGTNSSPSAKKEPNEIIEQIARSSMEAYQRLISKKGFWKWYIKMTPIEHISHLPIASRPVSRKSAGEVDFDGLRAIPWVFAWTQTRYNLPGWYGIGIALNDTLKSIPNAAETMQQWYKEWSFFKTIINNAQLEMKRTHLEIAKYYDDLAENGFHKQINEDFKKSTAAICLITGQKEILDNAEVLKKSIDLRNPYTDVLNLLQVKLLQDWQNATEIERESLRQALFLSINGIAAAMQSTG